MEFEEKYEDVLQNIEFGIVAVYREKPGLTDYAVMRSLEAIIDHYVAETKGRPSKNFSLSDLESEIVQRVTSVCEWRLGHGSVAGMPKVEPQSPDEIIQCLKRVLKSVQRWNKREGRQGYLRFVSQFVR